MFKRISLTPTESAWVVCMTPVTLMFALMIIKDAWIFVCRLCNREREWFSLVIRQGDLTQDLISMIFFIPQGKQTLHSANSNPLFPQILYWSFKDTLQIHSTCLPAPQGGNIVHLLHMLYTSISFYHFSFLLHEHMFVFCPTPFLILFLSVT